MKVLPERYCGIPIPKDIFLWLFTEKEVEDAFVYIETVLRAFYERGREGAPASTPSPPVLVLDELRVIGDLKVDESGRFYDLQTLQLLRAADEGVAPVARVRGDFRLCLQRC